VGEGFVNDDGFPTARIAAGPFIDANCFAHLWPSCILQGFVYHKFMPKELSELSNFQLQVVVGTLLGDSSLSRPYNGKNYHLSCYHAKKQAEWLTQKHAWLSPLSRSIQWCAYLDKRDGKTRAGGRFHTVSLPCFTQIAEILYPHGRKTITPAYLSLFQDPVALACLICDDGHWDGAGIGIASKQFSLAENKRLASHLSSRFNVRVSVQIVAPYSYVRICADGVARIIQLCEQFFPPSLRYKLGPIGYETRLCGLVEKECLICRTKFVSYASENQRTCSQACGNSLVPRGYAMRKFPQTTCACCGNSISQYTKKHMRCAHCRRKRNIPIPCIICHAPVTALAHVTCSRSCGVALGHRRRQ
jgi:hypothetical protein